MPTPLRSVIIRSRDSKTGASGTGFPYAIVFLAQYFLLVLLQVRSLARRLRLSGEVREALV